MCARMCASPATLSVSIIVCSIQESASSDSLSLEYFLRTTQREFILSDGMRISWDA